MKVGVLTAFCHDRDFEDMIKYLHGIGVQAVELASGGYPGKYHINPEELLKTPEKIDEIKAIIDKYGMDISAVSAHGNPVHPDKATAKKYHDDFINAILFAQKLGVDTIVGFSGCPGDHDGAKYPNWVTCAWPTDYAKVLEYQWDVLVKYWKETAEFAKAHGIKKIAFEMHPGFCVYNPATLKRLRAAVGDIIGANFDPSHLFWQGIDPVAAIKDLEGMIYHFHAKDTYIDKYKVAVNGVLDTTSLADLKNRSWYFRTLGYGSDEKVWKDIISALRLTGFDGILSIEHEDAMMTNEEGLEKAVAFLQTMVPTQKLNGDVFWA